jgi:hypothetical protein
MSIRRPWIDSVWYDENKANIRQEKVQSEGWELFQVYEEEVFE